MSEARLQEALDHLDIRRVLAEYCHACDRADGAMMAALYAGDDSFDDHGSVKAPGPEYAGIMTKLIEERTEAAWHILGQSIINVDGDRAAAETFFLAYFRLRAADGGAPQLNQLAGRFVDRLQRIDGRWKIKHRTCVRDVSLTQTIEKDAYAAYGFVGGRRDRDDPGAALLGLAHNRAPSTAGENSAT
ncbi:MAG: nuclear transport factor 2 family protein [Parvularculaceae bacterium]|nr:nuclear transport factor 2 family protein [Parvularculaceae bacterium]